MMLRRILQRIASQQIVDGFDRKLGEFRYSCRDASNRGAALGGITGTVLASSAFLRFRRQHPEQVGTPAQAVLLLSAVNLCGCSFGSIFGAIFFGRPMIVLAIAAVFGTSAAAIETQNIYVRKQSVVAKQTPASSS